MLPPGARSQRTSSKVEAKVEAYHAAKLQRSGSSGGARGVRREEVKEQQQQDIRQRAQMVYKAAARSETSSSVDRMMDPVQPNPWDSVVAGYPASRNHPRINSCNRSLPSRSS